MYRFLLIVAVVLACSLVACGGDEEAGQDSTATETVSGTETIAATGSTNETVDDSGETFEVATARAVSYAQDVLPIFEAKCIDCHHPTNAVKAILTDIFDLDTGAVTVESYRGGVRIVPVDA